MTTSLLPVEWPLGSISSPYTFMAWCLHLEKFHTPLPQILANFVKASHFQAKRIFYSYIRVRVNIPSEKEVLVLLKGKIYQSVSAWLKP